MTNKRRTFWLIVALGAGLWIGITLIALVAVLILPLLVEPGQDVSANILAGGLLVNLGFAIALEITAIYGWQGKPSSHFSPRRVWPPLLVIWVLFVAGAAVLPPSWQGSLLLIPFHLALIVLPAWILFSLITLVGGRDATLTWRQVWIALTSGLASTLLALPLELIGLLLVSILVPLFAALIPGGQAELMRLSMELQRWTESTPAMTTLEDLTTLLASPVTLAVLALLLSVITPVVEELGKTLVLPFIMFCERPGLVRAFLWGAACGFGFAIIEGVYSGALGMGESAGWLAGTAMRLPATAMHALVSGITGLGWGIFWQKRRGRWAWLLLTYGIAIGFHGLWNFNAVLMVFAGLASIAGAALQVPEVLSGFVMLVAGSLLGIMAISAPVGLFALPWWLRRCDARPFSIQNTAQVPESL